ncbi:MAG: hypothetical protein KF889_08865 [Alphaproteobacteria bacterium]|nr:hypothetical protein [Alphaproteobacteria bacterium]MCW5740933.1 hypothetical protein [Alphaproteobacteria bacterium]
MIRLFAPLALGTVAWLLLVLVAPALRAQEGWQGEGHAQYHEWYRQLMHPVTGLSCCDGRDCRPTRAYRDHHGWWRAMLNGRWKRVPPEAVLNIVAPDGNSHICADETEQIHCFVGGLPKS